jgi:hypothetical protein
VTNDPLRRLPARQGGLPCRRPAATSWPTAARLAARRQGHGPARSHLSPDTSQRAVQAGSRSMQLPGNVSDPGSGPWMLVMAFPSCVLAAKRSTGAISRQGNYDELPRRDLILRPRPVQPAGRKACSLCHACGMTQILALSHARKSQWVIS